MMEKIHLGLLNYLPLAGFGLYALLTGFDNPLFLPILLTGWIVLVVFQTILTAVYTPPRFIWIAILSMLLTPTLLLVNAIIRQDDPALPFIEMAGFDLMGLIIGLILAIVLKLMREGIREAPLFPILFTIGLFATAAFFLGKLFYHFLALSAFDWVTVVLVLFGISRSAAYFVTRMSKLTGRFGSSKGKTPHDNSSPKREFSAGGILITLGIWLIVIPLIVWIRSLIIPYQ